MFTEIDAYVAKHIKLDKKELEYFHSLLKYKKVKKKKFLLQAGEVCDFEAYIIKGCMRIYFIDENGFEVDLSFSVEDWWVSDINSFITQTPADLFIQTLEDCEILTISYNNKEKLYERVPKFERLFRIMIQRGYNTAIKRLISTISKPAEERYLDFIKKYPGIPQRVPQHLIAAYLGISPEFLSKIRKKLSKR